MTILAEVDNPNIINLYDVFISKSSIDIVTEYCRGGSLLDRMNILLSNNKCFTEEQASIIMKQVFSALNYAHKKFIAHRDIKLENILFVNHHPDDLTIKVIDFGLSTYNGKEIHNMKEKLGTCYYISPEILQGDYNEKCDIWACGVLLYILLIGIPPFGVDGYSNEEMIYRRIKKLDYSFYNSCKIRILYIFNIIYNKIDFKLNLI